MLDQNINQHQLLPTNQHPKYDDSEKSEGEVHRIGILLQSGNSKLNCKELQFLIFSKNLLKSMQLHHPVWI